MVKNIPFKPKEIQGFARLCACVWCVVPILDPNLQGRKVGKGWK